MLLDSPVQFILQDIDGVLANNREICNKFLKEPMVPMYDEYYKELFNVEPIKIGFNLLNALILKNPDVKLFFMTGRCETHAELTRKWLCQHSLLVRSKLASGMGFLLMRPKDSRDKPAHVKLKQLDYIRGQPICTENFERVFFDESKAIAFDDDVECCQMYHDQGITVLNVISRHMSNDSKGWRN